MLRELRVGRILTTHGLKGEVKVAPTTDDPTRFFRLRQVFLRPGRPGFRSAGAENALRSLEVASVRTQGEQFLLKFKGLDRLEDVQALRNYDLLVSREDAIPLSEGEYFLGDYIGAAVLTDAGETFGRIREVLETGANPVFVVEHAGREVLIPKSPNCVLEERLEEGYIRVHVLEGLLDL